MFASSSVRAAPGQPDAGQTLRELQQQPTLTAPKATPSLRMEDDAAPKGTADDAARIAVKAIQVAGSSVFPASELESLVTDLTGGERSLAELKKGAARITAYYRARGYVVARAYLPAQDIKDGVVTISVLEGLVGQQRIDNQSRLSDEQVKDYLSGVKKGAVLQSKPVDRAILLLNDTPGVGGARATLQPGASVGTSDLLVELTPAVPYSASVELDDYGNRYTGERRLGAALALNSPLRFGDQLMLRALTSDMSMTYARLAYAVPLGSSGLRAGAAYSDTRYRLGQEYASLQGHGTATSGSLYATYPFIRSQASSLSGTLTGEDKKLNDKTDNPVTSIDKRVRLVSLGLSGNHQDGLGGGGLNTMDLSLVSGDLGMDPVSLAADARSANSNGSFMRLTYNLSRLQRLTDTDALSIALAGQQADKNLNSSEKFSLGGAYSVRAYPQGEGIGDVGWLANLELRHSYSDTLQGVLFYDEGSVKINHNPFAATANNRNIAGAGFGVNTKLSGVQIKAYAAWRTSGGTPLSEPASVIRSPRVWVQVSKQF